MGKQDNKTIMHRKEDSKRTWFILDAEGKTLGRFASEVAKILRGKHKPTFTTFSDAGDGVIILNASKIHVTGNKAAQKEYFSYTGYMGGLRRTPFRVMLDRNPQEILRHAVAGMMPKTRLSNAQLKHLRIYAGAEHDQIAQQPIKANI